MMGSFQPTDMKRVPSLCSVLIQVLGREPGPSWSLCSIGEDRRSPKRQAVISDSAKSHDENQEKRGLEDRAGVGIFHSMV